MSISICFPGSWSKRTFSTDHQSPYIRSITGNASHALYTRQHNWELLSIFEKGNNVSYGFEFQQKCLGKVLRGQYDVGFESIPFPTNSSKLIQDSYIFSSKLSILTAIDDEVGYVYVEPDYQVYSITIYVTIFAFLFLCSLLNVSTYTFLGSHKRRTISWIKLTKKFLSNYFELTFAHFGKTRNNSPLRLLQLAVLLNITNLNNLYNAQFSTTRVQIEYPKIYDSYKSIYTDDALLVFVGPRQISRYIKVQKFRPSSVEVYLQKMMNETGKIKARLKGEREMCKIVNKFQKNKKLVLIAHTFIERKFGCNLLKGCIKKNRGKDVNPRVIIRHDPNADEIKSQISILKTVKNKSGSDILLRRMRMLSENGLYLAIHQFESSLGRRSGKRTSRAFFDARTCVIESVEPEIDSFENINLKVIRGVFFIFPILVELACVFIILENVLYYFVRRKRRLVAPMATN